MRPIVRGAAAALAVPALSLSALVATSAPAAAATDPAPATAAGYWLSSQLTDGLLLSPYVDEEGNPYVDHGATIDTALAFDAAGAPASVVEGISDAMAGVIDDYVAPGGGTDLSAGSAAKSIVLALAADDDPTSFGGRDLVADLEGRVATEGSIAGRIQDDWEPVSEYSADYANVAGQAFAVQALDAVGSELVDSATDYLLSQQCEDGFFQLYFPDASEADQSCDGNGGSGNVDATALAIEGLQSQADDTDVAGQVDAAVDWLLSIQRQNGSFGSDADIPAPNANSTGAAAYALLITGHAEAAADAAAWLRAHQATNVENCVYYDEADTGAVLYDNAAQNAAQGGAMDDQLAYQSARATAQAIPGLLAAQTGAGDPQPMFAAEYVKAGGKKPVGVVGAAPGEALCAMLREQSVLGYAGVDGEAKLPVRIPNQTATSIVQVANAAGEIGTVEIDALAQQKLKVVAKKKRVANGAKQLVTVRDLAPGESVSISITWPSTKNGGSASATVGQANGKGVFKTRVKAPKKGTGTAKVKAAGAFKNRKGSTTFTVTR